MSTDTTTDPTPPPPPVPPQRVVGSLMSVTKKNKTKYVSLGGAGPHVQVQMSQSFLSTQVRISCTYVFELYFEYFVGSFRGFLGIPKSFETDDEVYNLVYRPRFRKYYKHTDGGWAGRLVPDKLKELRCHLSWVVSMDSGEWGVQDMMDPYLRSEKWIITLNGPKAPVVGHLRSKGLRIWTQLGEYYKVANFFSKISIFFKN